MIRSVGACAASLVLFGICAVAGAEEKSAETFRDLPAFFALPVELDFDRGAANGNAAIMRIMPLYKFPLGKNMELANLTILTLADAPGTPVFPGEPGAGKTAGVSDLLHASPHSAARNGPSVRRCGSRTGRRTGISVSSPASAGHSRARDPGMTSTSS
jgi:hypothetical protein